MHRDLKLANIMMQDNGYIKLIDFGLAKVLEPGEFSGDFVGTKEYMAPEMLDMSYTEDSVKYLDWWAVGIIAYELRFGQTPFFDDNQRVMNQKIKTEDVFFPEMNRKKFPYSDNFRDFVEKLLEREPTKRLGS